MTPPENEWLTGFMGAVGILGVLDVKALGNGSTGRQANYSLDMLLSPYRGYSLSLI